MRVFFKFIFSTVLVQCIVLLFVIIVPCSSVFFFFTQFVVVVIFFVTIIFYFHTLTVHITNYYYRSKLYSNGWICLYLYFGTVLYIVQRRSLCDPCVFVLFLFQLEMCDKKKKKTFSNSSHVEDKIVCDYFCMFLIVFCWYDY